MNINLHKKFQKRIEDSFKVCSEGSAKKYFDFSCKSLDSLEDKGIQAGILSNFSKVMDDAPARDFMKTNNYGPFLPELWPIITAWYPEFPLNELISVQDMEQDLAYIITSELLAGTTKADTLIGDKVETPMGTRVLKGRYPTGEVFGEVIEADGIVNDSTSYSAALAYYPLLTSTESLADIKIVATIGTDFTYTATGVNAGEILLSDGADKTGKIEISTGVITLEGLNTAVTKLVCTYTWNIEFADDKNIPTVVEDMKMVPLQARPQVLAMKWTIFSEFVKKRQFGIDVRTQTTKRVLDLLYQYQVRYVLDKLESGSSESEQTITIPTDVVSLDVVVQKTLEALNVQSQKIAYNTGRIEGNCIVTGSYFKGWLESLPNTYYKPVSTEKDYGFQGPRKIGEIGRYKVFYDDRLATDKAFMTYRGSQWYDAAAYYGVFLPITSTDVINLNINVQSAFVTMTAFRLDKPSAIIPLSIESGPIGG